jgi:hypothetical protein
MHWRRPSTWPEDLEMGEGKIKGILREIIFKKYW